MSGRFSRTPGGIILHGSRSDNAFNSQYAEYIGTATYAASGIVNGWNVTIGDDTLALHMDYAAWGWNAREHSSVLMGAEFAQAVEAWDVTNAQVRAFCWFYQQARKRWPALPAYFPTHSELPAGIRDGKTDTFSRGSPRNDDLRARINARLAAFGITYS